MKIRIPEPCHEDWNKMTPKEQGRHCASCDKTVVDFTGMSDKQMVALIQKGESTCGRFSNYQLNRQLVLHHEPPKHFGLLKLAACAVLSVNLFDGFSNQAPRNYVERHDLPKYTQNDSIPMPFNGMIQFKINAAQNQLDSLQHVLFQLNDFRFVLEQVDSNQIYEFHVPDSVLWEKIEIFMVSHDSASTNLEILRQHWMRDYQVNNEPMVFIYENDSFRIQTRFENLINSKIALCETVSTLSLEELKIFTPHGLFMLGDVRFEQTIVNSSLLKPRTAIHPQVFISAPEPILEYEEEIEVYAGIFQHKPNPAQSVKSPWKTFYYIVLAGIVGFFTRWAYRNRAKRTTDSEIEL